MLATVLRRSPAPAPRQHARPRFTPSSAACPALRSHLPRQLPGPSFSHRPVSHAPPCATLHRRCRLSKQAAGRQPLQRPWPAPRPSQRQRQRHQRQDRQRQRQQQDQRRQQQRAQAAAWVAALSLPRRAAALQPPQPQTAQCPQPRPWRPAQQKRWQQLRRQRQKQRRRWRRRRRCRSPSCQRRR